MRPDEQSDFDARIEAGTTQLGASDAGELLTLQLAAWVKEGREAATIDIPPLRDELSDVLAQLADPALTIWGYREGSRLIATVRTSTLADRVAFLGRLGVVPDRFRQGIGGSMLRLAESRIPPDTRRIELVTGIRSFSNHAFYARHGYSIYRSDEVVGIVRLSKDF